MAKPKAFIFDAYGTLFDVHSVVEAGRADLVTAWSSTTLWLPLRRRTRRAQR